MSSTLQFEKLLRSYGPEDRSLLTASHELYNSYVRRRPKTKNQLWSVVYFPSRVEDCLLPFDRCDSALAIYDWIQSWKKTQTRDAPTDHSLNPPFLDVKYWERNEISLSTFPGAPKLNYIDPKCSTVKRQSPRLLEQEHQRVDRVANNVGFFSPYGRIMTKLSIHCFPGSGLKTFLHCSAKQIGLRIIEIDPFQLQSKNDFLTFFKGISQNYTIEETKSSQEKKEHTNLTSMDTEEIQNRFPQSLDLFNDTYNRTSDKTRTFCSKYATCDRKTCSSHATPISQGLEIGNRDGKRSEKNTYSSLSSQPFTKVTQTTINHFFNKKKRLNGPKNIPSMISLHPWFLEIKKKTVPFIGNV